MKKPVVIAINHKRNTEAALASLNSDLDSKPQSKGDKLFSFTTAKTGRLREILDDKLDEMFQADPSLSYELHYDCFGNRIHCVDCDKIIPLKVKVCWNKGKWFCRPCYEKQFEVLNKRR